MFQGENTTQVSKEIHKLTYSHCSTSEGILPKQHYDDLQGLQKGSDQ